MKKYRNKRRKGSSPRRHRKQLNKLVGERL